MSAAAESIRSFLGLHLAGWHFQFGRWNDRAGAKTDRYAVLRPVGGAPAELLRRPQFTLTLIGRDGGDISEASAQADALVETMRQAGPEGTATFFLQPAEPVHMATNDNRPVFEIAISALTT